MWIVSSYAGTDGYTNPKNVPIFDMRGAGSLSFASGGASLNSPNVWTAIQTFSRTAETGTPLTTGVFGLSGWGSGANVLSASGYDAAHTFTITGGSSPSAAPTITMNYVNGNWSKNPIVQAQWSGGTGQSGDVGIVSTIGGYTLTFYQLPVLGATYQFTVTVVGLS